MKNYFLLIVLAAYDLVLAGPVWAFNIDQFHANIAHKYGVQTSKLSVEPVIRPGYIDKLTRLGERTLQRLEKFANTLESNTFRYRLNREYWRLTENDRVLSYTFSIDIIKADRKTFDYYCWSVLSPSDDNGLTMGCSAIEAE